MPSARTMTLECNGFLRVYNLERTIHPIPRSNYSPRTEPRAHTTRQTTPIRRESLW